MAEFENLRQTGSGLSEQAALVLPPLKQHGNFGRALAWVKPFAFSIISVLYNEDARRCCKIITVLQVGA